MDLNQSIEFNSSSPQVHNFMPMSSNFIISPYHQPSKGDYEEFWQSRFMEIEKQTLEIFWNQQVLEIQNTSAFKSHQLPLARIKRIMKIDEGVKMISADTPILFSKAIELFISELTLRSWLQAELCKRRTLHRCDIARAIKHEDLFDFLADLVPHHHCQEDGESEKCCEEIELLSGIQEPYPMIDINQDLIIANQEIPQQFMIGPSMTSAEFNNQSEFQQLRFIVEVLNNCFNTFFLSSGQSSRNHDARKQNGSW